MFGNWLKTSILMAGILARGRGGVDLYPVVSPLQVLLLALDLDATADLEIIDAGSLPGAARTRDAHLIVTGVDNPILARAVAGQLRDRYAPDHTRNWTGAAPAPLVSEQLGKQTAKAGGIGIADRLLNPTVMAARASVL